jgi:hypothetical protein
VLVRNITRLRNRGHACSRRLFQPMSLIIGQEYCRSTLLSTWQTKSKIILYCKEAMNLSHLSRGQLACVIDLDINDDLFIAVLEIHRQQSKIVLSIIGLPQSLTRSIIYLSPTQALDPYSNFGGRYLLLSFACWIPHFTPLLNISRAPAQPLRWGHILCPNRISPTPNLKKTYHEDTPASHQT